MNRDEWRFWRHQGIGSSDAASVWNLSPYKTAYELYVDKISQVKEEKTNFILEKGNQLEPIARTRFAALYNIDNGVDETFDPMLVELKTAPFIRASLDGISKDRRTSIEIKYQGKQAHENVKSGIVAEHYRIQIMHQLLVSGCERAFLVSFDGTTMNTTLLVPDYKFMQTHVDKCFEFWDRVQRKNPPPFVDDDFKTLRVKGAKAKIQKWKELNRMINQVESDILEMTTHDRMICDGIRINNGKFEVS